jgi:hypothetical protein
MGEILEVQIKLTAGYVGEFVRVCAKIDVKKRLTRFVSITKEEKKVWYQVKYMRSFQHFAAIAVYSVTGIKSVAWVSMMSLSSTGEISCWSVVVEEVEVAVEAEEHRRKALSSGVIEAMFKARGDATWGGAWCSSQWPRSWQGCRSRTWVRSDSRSEALCCTDQSFNSEGTCHGGQ